MEKRQKISDQEPGDKKSMKSLIKLFLHGAENQELKLKRLKKMLAREMQVEDEERKRELGDKIDDYLRKHNTKYATDGKIVRLAVET